MASDRLQRRLERLLDEAEAAITQLDWRVVYDRAQAVLAIEPENSDGRAFLATAERALATAAPTPSEIPTSAPTTTPIATTHHPTSFANGRYQVKQFLGEGGKKKVYLAHDGVLDRDVALAVIKFEGLDDVSRTRINREAQAMGRLGDHPNILQIHDLGEDHGQPYLVLPLMSGGSVEGLIDNSPGHRIDLEQALDIAKQVCRGLEFAHSRGIVHRDLKPGNVWLSDDGTPKIGDFGLAVVLDRSRITGEGMMVGTVSYMPPEQAMGGEVTPQSDLYSLGAMLYEMITGRPPFLGDDAVAIIGQHINTPPVSPIWHNADCPRPLEALILRLLAKNRAERSESATDVLSALNAIDLAAPVEERPEEEAHSLDSLAGGVFVGRQQEMGELKAALEDSLSGRGRLVMLVGEPGIGKTRTAQELATYAGMRGAQVLWGRCYEEQGMPPYWPWVQAIRSYVRERDPDQLRSEMGAGAPDIAEIVSDVRERLPDLQPTPQLEPDQARFRLFDSITTFLKAAGQQQPLVLMLDDLHWADQPSLLLLEFLTRELAGARLLVVGTYRDVELNRQHPLAETLGGLNRERLFQRVLLRGLTQEDVARFIEIASGITPPSGLVSAVHTQTEGNPLFVTEVVRLLVQEGELTAERGSTRESWTVRIPEGVREVIGRRLNRLSQRCNETLTMASVIGREFELSQLSPLIQDMSEDRLLEMLEEALGARVIEELPQAVGRYQFTHALIQETLAGELSTTRRVRLHARIGEALEDMYGEEAEAHAAELAHHFAEAEAVTGTEKLVRYSRLAGERALASYAWEEAQTHFQRGLMAKEDGPKDMERADLLFGLARAQLATLERSRMDEAFANLKSAFDHYIEVGDLASVMALAEVPLEVVGTREYEGISELVARAMALAPAGSLVAASLLCQYGQALYRESGDYDGAQAALGQALVVAQREGDAILEMRALVSSAHADAWHFHFGEALEKDRRALDLGSNLNQPQEELHAYLEVASVMHHTGDLEGARHYAAVMLAVAEKFRYRTRLAQALQQNTIVGMLEGDWASARQFSDRLFEVAPRQAFLFAVRAIMEYNLGNFEEGRRWVDGLLELMEVSGPGPTPARQLPAIVIAMCARASMEALPLDQVVANARLVISFPGVTPVAASVSAAGLALVAVQRSDPAEAEEQYGVLQGRGGTMLGTANESLMSADRLLGLLSHTMGNMDQAAGHFEDALAFCRKAGYRPELAWTCCDYSDTLRERDAEDDRAKAVALLDESLAISSELGMRPLMERVLSRKLELQGVASEDIRTSIDHVATAVTEERPDLRPHAAPDGTVTILFSDIEGSTQMTERLGDQRMQQVLRGHNDIVRHQVAAFDGFEVKSLGDGFMLAFSSARRALQCAMAIQRAFAAYNRGRTEDQVQVRIGLHTGEFVQEMEDFFGKNVILAARIADQAQGGEILVSSLLKELTDSAGDIQFGEGQEVELKGLAGVNRVYAVEWR